jgi:hypothetical protein
MAGELRFRSPDYIGDTTLYARLYNAVGAIYNTSGGAMESVVAGNVADYDIAVTENPTTGHFAGNMPAAQPAGIYDYDICKRAGANPAWTDRVVAQAVGLQWDGSAEVTLDSRAVAGDAMTLTAAYDAAKTAAQAGDAMDLVTDAVDAATLATSAVAEIAAAVWNRLTSALTTVGSIGKLVVDYLDAKISTRATSADVSCTLAVSATEAEAAASGTLAITLWHTFSQAVSSTVTADLSSATKLWWAVKLDREVDTDAESLVFVEEAGGLQYLGRTAYAGAVTNGSIAVSGESGDWEVTLGLSEAVTGELASWKNKSTVKAEVKALIAGDTVNVWSGSCTISAESVRAVS